MYDVIFDPPGSRAKVLNLEAGAGFGGSVVALAKLTKLMREAGYEAVGAVLHDDLTCASYLREMGIAAIHLHAYRRSDETNRLMEHIARTVPPAKAPLLGLVLAFEWALSRRDMSRLRRLMNREDPDLVALNNGARRDILHLAASCKMLERTIVHGRGVLPPGNRQLHPHYPMLVAMSKVIRQSYLDAGWPAERTNVIYDPFPIPEPPAAPPDWGKLAPHPRSVALVGSLEPWKGHVVFVDAASSLAAKYRDVGFLIVGGETLAHSGYRTSLVERIKERGLQDRIVITGWRRDVLAIMAAADVVVHSSLKPEPFGNVVAEAMSLAKPVVASNAGGPREMIRDGVDGILAAPGSADSLATAIGRLLDRREYAASLGAQAQRRVREMFSEQRFVSEMKQVYEALLTAQ